MRDAPPRCSCFTGQALQKPLCSLCRMAPGLLLLHRRVQLETAAHAVASRRASLSGCDNASVLNPVLDPTSAEASRPHLLHSAALVQGPLRRVWGRLSGPGCCRLVVGRILRL